MSSTMGGTGTIGGPGTMSALLEGDEAPDYTWQPEVWEVGALIHARTKQRGGKGELGTFNAHTRPTGQQVEYLILQACRRVATAIGAEPCTEALKGDAKAAAAIYAAMLIEQSYWPEQTVAQGSSFKNLEALWKDQIRTLTEAVAEQCGGSGEAVGSGGQIPREGSDELPLIGRTGPLW